LSGLLAAPREPPLIRPIFTSLTFVHEREKRPLAGERTERMINDGHDEGSGREDYGNAMRLAIPVAIPASLIDVRRISSPFTSA
jgi:hypothetical protein